MAESKYTAPNDFRAFCEMLGETENSITHHGIKGQRWGIRRFQNKDGTLTGDGKKRYEDKMSEALKRPARGQAKKDSKAFEKVKTRTIDAKDMGYDGPVTLVHAMVRPSGSINAMYRGTYKKVPVVANVEIDKKDKEQKHVTTEITKQLKSAKDGLDNEKVIKGYADKMGAEVAKDGKWFKINGTNFKTEPAHIATGSMLTFKTNTIDKMNDQPVTIDVYFDKKDGKIVPLAYDMAERHNF